MLFVLELLLAFFLVLLFVGLQQKRANRKTDRQRDREKRKKDERKKSVSVLHIGLLPPPHHSGSVGQDPNDRGRVRTPQRYIFFEKSQEFIVHSATTTSKNDPPQ